MGRGAFGSVFLARHRTLGRMVALKISATQGFESQTLAQLDHPYYRCGVFDQRHLADRRVQSMYMQYVAGGTLEGLVNACGTSPPALRTGKIIAQYVDAAIGDARRVAAGRFALAAILVATLVAAGRVLARCPAGRSPGTCS